MLKPILESVDDVWPLCGDIVYTFVNTAGTGDLIQSIIPAHAENTIALAIVVQSDDYLLAVNGDPALSEYTKTYRIDITV